MQRLTHDDMAAIVAGTTDPAEWCQVPENLEMVDAAREYQRLERQWAEPAHEPATPRDEAGERDWIVRVLLLVAVLIGIAGLVAIAPAQAADFGGPMGTPGYRAPGPNWVLVWNGWCWEWRWVTGSWG